MALRDVMVHVDASQAGMTRLRLAADLAARHGARLTALHVRARSIRQERRLKIAELGLVPAASAGADLDSVDAELDADSTMLRGLLQQLHEVRQFAADWCEVSGNTAKIVVQRSRFADLTIVGHDTSDDNDLPDSYSFAESILFLSGRPLIIIPPGVAQTTLGRIVALAWNGSRPAARALSDAIPLIERAERSTVLIASPQPNVIPEALPAEDILINLRYHTGTADMVTFDHSHGGATGDLLQTQALALGADLLVAGAFGHPHLWEKMLGGTTQDMLARMRIPMLMSH